MKIFIEPRGKRYSVDILYGSDDLHNQAEITKWIKNELSQLYSADTLKFDMETSDGGLIMISYIMEETDAFSLKLAWSKFVN